jgi:hypothetical protein
MKKIFLTLLIFTLPSLLIAKKSSQLVFSRVATFIPSYNASTQTSPYYKPDSGKVWKIENFRCAAENLTNNAWTLEFNGQDFPGLVFNENFEPLWISASDSIRFQNYSNNVRNVLVSMLEFQIID